MTNIITAIDNDTDEYISLCNYFNEEPVNDELGVNPYCEHAKKLCEKYNQEKKLKESEANNEHR